MKIFALCGSIRKNSSNFFLLTAAQIFFKHHEWSTLDLAELPYFDPDQQYNDDTPDLVTEMRRIASHSDLILISTPEYAHGIPGILKNGLEWLFSEETQKKPVAVIIGSAQGENTRDQLLEILKTMDFSVSMDRFLIFKGARSRVTHEGNFTNQSSQEEFENFCRTLPGVDYQK